MAPRRVTAACLGGAGLALVACGPRSEPVEKLVLTAFRQAGEQNVCLNEELVFHFSASLDRTSVTSASVRITGPDGEPARGRLAVSRSTVTFLPDLPLSPDLSDGGLRPEREYTVELGGFPRPDGIRSRRGHPLSQTLRFAFRTAALAGTYPLFLDTFSERPYPLGILTQTLSPLGPILLQCGEPVDPSSLSAEDFELFPLEARRADPRDILPLEPRLLENRRDRATIELRPLGPTGGTMALDQGTYFLRKARFDLRNLGGRSIQVAWPKQIVPLEVIGRRRESSTFAFQSAVLRSNEAPLGLDGTAHWSDQAPGVHVRFPAAAGTGEDGEVILASLAEGGRTDFHAGRLEIPAEAHLDLSDVEGPVILRSQGPLRVAGHLLRDGAPSSSAPSPLAEELLRASQTPVEDRETLSAWLDRLAESGEPWTVLVAGGDLLVEGEIAVDGPLLLVAGGWIRVSGRVSAREVWKTPEGGQNAQARLRIQEVPLRIDAPEGNPLRVPLRLGVLSVPFRPPRGVESWEPAFVLGRKGGGRLRVQFLGLVDRGDRIESFGPVEDLTLLDGCEAVRLFVVLEVPPGRGEPWNPPFLERVDLAYIEPVQRPGSPQEPQNR